MERKWRAWVDGEPDGSGHGGNPDAAVGHLVRSQADQLGVVIEDTP